LHSKKSNDLTAFYTTALPIFPELPLTELYLNGSEFPALPMDERGDATLFTASTILINKNLYKI
jgi:hypothetical protein